MLPGIPFHIAPGRCLMFVADEATQGRPMMCPNPAPWRGTFFDALGRAYTADACDDHMRELLDPTTAVRPT